MQAPDTYSERTGSRIRTFSYRAAPLAGRTDCDCRKSPPERLQDKNKTKTALFVYCL